MKLLILFILSAVTMSSYAANLKKIPDCDNMPGACDNLFKLERHRDYNNQKCSVRMYDRYNRVIDRFQAPRCTTALNRCNAEIQRNHYRGAHCQIMNQRPPREITRSCTYHAIENRGRRSRVNATFRARARGVNPVRVQERACDKAYRKCMNFRNYYERCVRDQRD